MNGPSLLDPLPLPPQPDIVPGPWFPLQVQIVFPDQPFSGVLIQFPNDQPTMVCMSGGPAGPVGPAGPQGPIGPDGAAAPTAELSGYASIPTGATQVTVTFPQSLPTAEWSFIKAVILNVTDSSPLNIREGIITDKTENGFTMQLDGITDSPNYFLGWTIRPATVPVIPATTYLLTGPASGPLGSPSTFTVQLPLGTTVPGGGGLNITPSDGGGGGTFTPAIVALTNSTPSATFHYTPASYGTKTISCTNDLGLTDPAPLSFLSRADHYTLTGPSSGNTGSPSTPFTVALPSGGVVSGTVTVTPHTTGTGTFTPATVALTTAAPSATFTYTPTVSGTDTISTTNNGGLTDPSSLSYVSSTPMPHLLNNLISYWKLDEAAGTTRNDSKGTNNLLDTGGVGSLSGVINNCAFFNSTDRLQIASNSTLQVTGDFTFAFWVQCNNNVQEGVLGKYDPVASAGDYQIYHDNTSGQKIVIYFPSVSALSVSSPVITLSTFHYVIAWYDSSDQKLRIMIDNGAPIASTGSGALPTPTTIPFAIGGWANLNQFQGNVDEVGFWKRKLTSVEMTALWNGGAGLPFSSFTT